MQTSINIQTTIRCFSILKFFWFFKTVPHPLYSPDLAPCDFWLFPKLRGCRYETIEEMKEAVTKVIDTLTQEDFHGDFQKLLERYNKCIAAGGDWLRQVMGCVLANVRAFELYLTSNKLRIFYFDPLLSYPKV